MHVNCALWSAEAFEDEMDGTLQNVQTAISRGKMMVRTNFTMNNSLAKKQTVFN